MVFNKDALFEAFEKLRPQDKGMYKIQKTLSFGASGTIFLKEVPEKTMGRTTEKA